MAKAPVNSTYTNEFIPLVREINSRGSTNNKDEYYTNVFPEQIKNEATKEQDVHLIKRAGVSTFISSIAGTTLRGMFQWKDQDKLFVVVDRNCYVYTSSTGALITTLVNIVGAGTTPVGMCNFLFDTGVVSVCITDGTTLSQISTTNVVTVNADADIPVPHLPTPFFYDAYLLLVKTGTSDLYNSDVNNPFSWTPGNFISAEMRADLVTGVMTMNNYFLLLGNKSIEYFWDAANATGSPFQRNDTPIKLAGYVGGVCQFGNKVYLVGEEVEGQPNVYELEDFKMTPVGNEAIRRHLSSVSLTNVTGNVISINGVDVYVLDTGTATYFMALDTHLWGLLTYQATTRFPMGIGFSINTSVGNTSLFTLQGATAVYKFDPALYQDNGVNFPCIIVTDTQQFSGWNQKFMSSLFVYADRPDADASVLVQWTDDDYKTYNTGLSVNLNQERPDINRLGRFRKRAFKLTYTTAQSLRISKLEVEINTGVH